MVRTTSSFKSDCQLWDEELAVGNGSDLSRKFNVKVQPQEKSL
jgi:hypothetical protein